MKRLKNIEGKNEQQLELIKNQGEKQLNLINKSNLEQESKQLEIEIYLDPEAKRLIDEINKEIKDNEDNLKLEDQAQMERLLMSLKKYDPSNDYKIKTTK